LFYVEGLLIKEIAICLNMKEGTVKWHLSDGRSKLKTFFNNTVKTQFMQNNINDMDDKEIAPFISFEKAWAG